MRIYVKLSPSPYCRCFIIDESGYVIMHPDFIGSGEVEANLVENIHISIKVCIIRNNYLQYESEKVYL